MFYMQDVAEGRYGPWMQLSSGKRFWPRDPRPEDIDILDIAAGLANDCRYAGQLKPGCYYSVAEHSILMMRYARDKWKWSAPECLAVLLHDAAEAYLNDLPRAVKQAVGDPYHSLESMVHNAILSRYGIFSVYECFAQHIKLLDRRIIPLEKAAIMNAAHEAWAFDVYQPLEKVRIRQWPPAKAYRVFLREARKLLGLMQIT